MTSTWRLFETYDAPSSWAMGLDEALLEDRSGAPPALRLYTWSPEAISLGWFQNLHDVPAARDGRCDVVRRLTGGGAIHHDAGELTFSIAIDEGTGPYRGPVASSYDRIHGAIEEALSSVGVVNPHMRRAQEAASDEAAVSGMCFHDSTAQDVGWEIGGLWRKGVGTAQRRRRGRLLHHGSIKLSASPSEAGIAALDLAGVHCSARDLGEALKDALRQRFDLTLEPTAVSDELAEAALRMGAKYGDPAFVNRPGRKRRRSKA